MKKTLLILVLALSNVSYSQSINPEMRLILDTVFSRTKEVSYYRKSVNWDSLETAVYQSAIGAQNVEELKPAFELILNGIRDHHGKVMRTADYSILAHFTDYKNARFIDDRAFDPKIWSIVNDLDARFTDTLLEGNIAYLNVVGVGPNVDGQTEAERIRCAVSKLHQQNVDKWIIDLRYNGGGNINVMLAGLAPLLDTKTVASIQDANGEFGVNAQIKKGNFYYAGRNVFKIKKSPKIKNPKIVILTSRWTISSGELVAVAFQGQKNTVFMGEGTAGYTTNNGFEPIGEDIALVISTGVYCDRNGTAYDKNIIPDVEIPLEVEMDPSLDNGILEAIKWLNSDKN